MKVIKTLNIKQKHIRLLIFVVVFITANCINAQSVFITKTGKKYHKEKCRYLSYSKKEISLKKAISLAYTACKICKPKTTVSNKKGVVNKVHFQTTTTTPKKRNYSVQCSGRTKSGKRCRRRTKSSNGRCYQH